jgi:hypothetical protein
MSGTSAAVAQRMIGAELLKLRRNRPLVAASLLLTTGIVVVMICWVATGQQAGGLHNFESFMRLIGSDFGVLVAVLVGVEAGAGDVASGVFRDLVVTGRSRLSLFLVRLPGALLLLLPLIALAFAVAVAAAYALAGALPTPSGSLVLEYGLWLALCGCVTAILSVGFAALIGSRSVATAILIGWFAIASPLLTAVTPLGAARQALPVVALEQLKPGRLGEDVVATSTATAVVVLLAWCLAACALGARRTRTQDA